jgi:plastocyanin
MHLALRDRDPAQRLEETSARESNMTARLLVGWCLMLMIFWGPALAGSIAGEVTLAGMRSNADAVVYVENIPGKTFEPPSVPVVMDQRGKEFIPRVLPILAGTKVDFLNSDPFNHNVFTPDKCGGKFDLGTWPTGETRSHVFGEPCQAVMLCNVHPAMVGTVVVLETPYFAVTDEEGRYIISDVPDGTYQVSVWHERLPKTTSPVEVAGETLVNFTLKR